MPGTIGSHAGMMDAYDLIGRQSTWQRMVEEIEDFVLYVRAGDLQSSDKCRAAAYALNKFARRFFEWFMVHYWYKDS